MTNLTAANAAREAFEAAKDAEGQYAADLEETKQQAIEFLQNDMFISARHYAALAEEANDRLWEARRETSAALFAWLDT